MILILRPLFIKIEKYTYYTELYCTVLIIQNTQTSPTTMITRSQARLWSGESGKSDKSGKIDRSDKDEYSDSSRWNLSVVVLCIAVAIFVTWFGLTIYISQDIHLDNTSVDGMILYIGNYYTTACRERTIYPIYYTQECVAHIYVQLRALEILAWIVIPPAVLYLIVKCFFR